VAFSPGGEQVASGSNDRRTIMWGVDTGRIWKELRTGVVVQAVAFAPNGRTLAVAGLDQGAAVVQLWDIPGSRLLESMPSPHGACRCVAFSPAGSVLACGSGSNILVLHAESLASLGTLVGHGHEVTSLAFASHGGILASGSLDQTVRLWDVTRFQAHRSTP